MRWLALDVFRAVAVLWMIQGHTFTALLGSGDIFKGDLGQIYRLLHGLTAPMFLAGAGLAYGIVTFSAPRPAAPGRMLRRALMLFAIGTVLQLPAAPVRAIIEQRALLAATLQPAALQLMAACLVVAELLRLIPGRLRFAATSLALSVAVAVITPWAWGVSLSTQYLLGSWIDGQTGAQFPLLPWLSFFLLGVAISALFGASLWRERARTPLIGLFGLALSALCYWLFLRGERLHALYGEHAFWLTSPMFMAFRAGLVLAWLGLLSAASAALARAFAAWPGLARLIAALSRHSLVAYVVHLSMLYGLPPLRGEHGVTPHFSLPECTAVCALILFVSVLSVLSWERLRDLVVGFVQLARTALRSASRSAGLTK